MGEIFLLQKPASLLTLPDLLVEPASFRIDCPISGGICRVSFRVKNAGTASTGQTGFYTYVYIYNNVVHSQPIPLPPSNSAPATTTFGHFIPLAAGQTVSYSYNYNFPAGDSVIYIWVDKTGLTNESNEANNLFVRNSSACIPVDHVCKDQAQNQIGQCCSSLSCKAISFDGMSYCVTQLPVGAPCTAGYQCNSGKCGEDKDKDGYLVPGKYTGFCQQAKAEYTDCDDNNAKVHPNSAFYDTPRPNITDPIRKWDYNCNGQINKEFPANCLANLSKVNCTTALPNTGKSGFVGFVPADCGLPGPVRMCYKHRTRDCSPTNYLPSKGSLCATNQSICGPIVRGQDIAFSISDSTEIMGCR